MTIINKKYIVKIIDVYGEKSFEIVNACHIYDKLGKYRKFLYDSKNGRCSIIFENNILTIIREGFFEHNFKIFFDGNKNKFLYNIDGMKQIFYSQGDKINYDENSKTFSFSYKLFDENNLKFNEISFFIKEIT